MTQYELKTKDGRRIPMDRHDVEVFAAIAKVMPDSWCVRIDTGKQLQAKKTLRMFDDWSPHA